MNVSGVRANEKANEELGQMRTPIFTDHEYFIGASSVKC